MVKYRLLDTFCGAGGATKGYQMAGFEVVGVDIKPQKHYVGEHFIQADALDVLYALAHGDCWDDQDGHTWHLEDLDAIHASPPCQGYSIMNNLPWLKGKEYPLLIRPIQEVLESIGKPYVIENVMGARQRAKGLMKRGLEVHGLEAGFLCGFMLGLPFPRHRLFDSNFLWLAPEHQAHRGRSPIIFPTQSGNVDPFYKDGKSIVGAGNKGKGSGLRVWQNGRDVGVGHAKGWHRVAETMGIDWMARTELTQAIPPAYTEFIGRQLAEFLRRMSDGKVGQ